MATAPHKPRNSAGPDGPQVTVVSVPAQAIATIAANSWRNISIALNKDVLAAMAIAGCKARRQVGSLLIPFLPPVELLAGVQSCFRRVVYYSADSAWCHGAQLGEQLRKADAAVAIGLVFDRTARLVTLIRGDLSVLTLPLETISPPPAGDAGPVVLPPGTQLQLPGGTYDLLNVIQTHDPIFRRARRRQQWKQSAHPGERIRHLRLARRLRREDIPGVDIKTVARIERGEIRTPQKETLRLIAAALRIPAAELETQIPPRKHVRRKAAAL